jgi:hypothetical protein
LGEKIEENERNKTPQSIGLEEAGLRRIRRRKAAARAARPEVEDEPDMWAPHVGDSRERRAGGGDGLGRRGPRAGRERVGPETAQRPREGFL